MSIDLSQNHFELFDLPVAFEIQQDRLDASYREIQSRVHPDRYAHSSDAERRLSMQWATRVNEAYQVLRSPLQRATYLLELHGMDVGAESNTAMPADFLMAQMEWREATEEAAASRSVEELDALLRRLRSEMREHYAELQQQIDVAKDYESAAQTVRRLMFLERLRSEIDDAIADIEG